MTRTRLVAVLIRVLVAVSIILSAGCRGPASDPVGPDTAGTIEVAGITRTYRLSVPADRTTPAPLIVDVSAHRCIDTSRIGIVGFSVGAVFAALYGCSHQDRIAAIITVEVDTPGPCTAPMPVMALHGTADPVVPYSVPPGSTALGGGSGTESNLAEWARISACAPAPVLTNLDNRVSRLTWSGCAAGSEVVLYRITGGGHEWPPADGVFDATGEAVAFLLRHPRR